MTIPLGKKFGREEYRENESGKWGHDQFIRLRFITYLIT
jgi:hypothetical protein